MELNDMIHILMVQNMHRLSEFSYWKIGMFAVPYFLSKHFFNRNRNVNYWDYINIYKQILCGTFFKEKYSLCLEGIYSSTPSLLYGEMRTSAIFNNTFKAIVDYILKKLDILDIKSIKMITESSFNHQNGYIEHNIFQYLINNETPILLNDELQIYIKFTTDVRNFANEGSKITQQIDYVRVEIYSYITRVGHIKKVIDDITENYLTEINEYRKNKIFVYTILNHEHANNIHKKEPDDSDDLSSLTIWKESLFHSSKTFENIFFENKESVLQKIDFFINNKEWYLEYGIPYTLGIGLHGPPGTGKTSFIKALAKYTNRHVVCISLKEINTRQTLENLYFENTYNKLNAKGSVGFDKKIIVFEDIDCIGDIVLDRSLKTDTEDDKLNQLQSAILKLANMPDSKIDFNMIPNTQKLTLDDILNLWDGIRENTGRILIMTSNRYEKLDSALIRPGRIDLAINLSNASHQTIQDIFRHLYKKEIPEEILEKINSDFYSPAELINLYVKHPIDSDAYIARLLQNKKV